MIPARFLLLATMVAPGTAWAQETNAVNEEPSEDIVVRATYGRTTMLFDKMPDGTLRNCRIMVSSGSQKRDTEACQATPVCFEKTRDEVTDCIELTALEQAGLAPGAPTPAPPSGTGSVQTFTMPQLSKPRPAASPDTIGPAIRDEDDGGPDRRRVTKLPPPPQAPSDGPTIRLSNGQEE